MSKYRAGPAAFRPCYIMFFIRFLISFHVTYLAFYLALGLVGTSFHSIQQVGVIHK